MSGSCSWRFRCAETADGLMGDQCSCNINSECVSGRCEGLNPPICEAKLANGASCNERSDCASGHCSWDFTCTDEATVTEELATKAKETSGIITIAAILVGVIVLCCVIQRCFWNRRPGYEEIPSQINV